MIVKKSEDFLGEGAEDGWLCKGMGGAREGKRLAVRGNGVARTF